MDNNHQQEQQSYLSLSDINMSQQLNTEVQSEFNLKISQFQEQLNKIQELHQQMKNHVDSHTCKFIEGSEYVMFEDYFKLEKEKSLIDYFLWPKCKEGQKLNQQMYKVCKQLNKLGYKNSSQQIIGYYIFI